MHDDFDLCGAVHVQRAGKREQKSWLKSVISHGWTVTTTVSTAASFSACLLFVLHRFDQTVVSLLSLLVCFMSSAVVPFRQQAEGRVYASYKLLWISRGSVCKNCKILYVLNRFAAVATIPYGNLVHRNTETHPSHGRHTEGIYTLQKAITPCARWWNNGLYVSSFLWE